MVECLCRVITREGGGDLGTVPLPIPPFIGLQIKTGKPIIMDSENNEYKGEGILTIISVTYDAKNDKLQILCNNKINQEEDWPNETEEYHKEKQGGDEG